MSTSATGFEEAAKVASAVAAGTGVAMTAAGFTSSGIVAGSFAAGIQSVIGNVAADSTFALIQSLAGGGFVTMAVVGLFAFFLSYM